MRRRDFLAASCLAGAAPLARLARGMEAVRPKKQLLELRVYRVGSEAQQKRLEEFLAKAMVPALGRIGISPVGVFRPAKEGELGLYVLLPHGSAESVVTCTARLLADAKFARDGAAWLDLPMSDPLYRRVESSLLLAFDGVPKVELHSRKDSRIFQLRIYESHSLKKGQKKIEMFNTGGELGVFRLCDMNPVFFGEALVGTKVPNLTYMLVFDDDEARKVAWGKFLKHPDWKKLKSDPQYKDTVSDITNIFLKPAPCSQI